MLWHDGDDAGAIKHAIKVREYVVSEDRAGRNVLVKAVERFSAEPWREEWWKTAESVTEALAQAMSVSGKSSRCAIMATYVDDCDLDAAKPLRALVAKILEDAAKLGFDPIPVCTTAGQPCDPGVRELVGSLLFLSRCTRFDLSFVVARLARFVTRWCEWARKESDTFSVLSHTQLNGLSP